MDEVRKQLCDKPRISPEMKFAIIAIHLQKAQPANRYPSNAAYILRKEKKILRRLVRVCHYPSDFYFLNRTASE